MRSRNVLRAGLGAGLRVAALAPRGVLAHWAAAWPTARWRTTDANPEAMRVEATKVEAMRVEATRATVKARTERWREREDHLLREAVAREAPENWAAVAQRMPGRSVESCRQRWVNHLHPNLVTGAWSMEEDHVLTSLVSELGEGKWVAVSAAMSGQRSPVHCENRWRRVLQPSALRVLHMRVWREEEDCLLRKAVAQEGLDNWAAVAQLVPGRSESACGSRWKQHLDPCLTTGAWSIEEDDALTKMVSELGEGKWVAVSAAMSRRRSPQQCKDRWRLHLQPSALGVRREGKWSGEEDHLLREAVARVGSHDWLAVAQLVPGRSWLACRQHWAYVLNTTNVVGPWSAEEDAMLTRLATEKTWHKGRGMWVAISAAMVGRSPKQCQQRWKQCLCPGLCKGPFSAQEDEILLAMVERVGRRWAVIADSLPGRTGISVRNRYHRLIRFTDQLPHAAVARSDN